jgi:hypothetical protein
MSEPQKRWPKVSDCHRVSTFVGTSDYDLDKYEHRCSECRQVCNPISDEGIQENCNFCGLSCAPDFCCCEQCKTCAVYHCGNCEILKQRHGDKIKGCLEHFRVCKKCHRQDVEFKLWSGICIGCTEPKYNPDSAETYKIVDEMAKSGGSFVSHLAALFFRGDYENRTKIVTTWENYFDQYSYALKPKK